MKNFPPLLVNVKKSQTRVDFNALWTRSTTLEKATKILWQQACACPCGTDHTDEDQTVRVLDLPVSCAMCGGSGRLYGAPQETWALLTDASREESVYTVWGSFSRGSMLVTFLPENLPGEWDRIILSEGHLVLTDRRQRKAVVERPRYPISKRTIPVGSGDGLLVPLEVTTGVIGCYKTLPDGGTDPTPLVEGTDFIVTDDGYIDWTLGDGLGTSPEVDSYYAVRYFARPVYVVRDFSYMRRDFYEVMKGELVYTHHPVAAVALLEHIGPPPAPSLGTLPTEKVGD